MRDVAQYLEVEAQVVEEWARERKIPGQQESGEWIFKKSAIDHWIQQERAAEVNDALIKFLKGL